MKNAEKFKSIFGLYATELWAMDGNDMLQWLDAECKESERKRGQWRQHIFDGIMGKRPRAWVCDNCNSLNIYKTDYCPNCGSYNSEEGG